MSISDKGLSLEDQVVQILFDVQRGGARLRPTAAKVIETVTAALVAKAAPEGPTLEGAREAFLNLIADAERFDEDVDGDTDGEGGMIVTVQYHLTTQHMQLDELFDALGFKKRAGETSYMALLRELEAPPAMLAPAPADGVADV